MVGVSGVRGVGTGIPLLRHLSPGALLLAILLVRQLVLGLVILLLRKNIRKARKTVRGKAGSKRVGRCFYKHHPMCEQGLVRVD